MKVYNIKIDRYLFDGEIKKENWKDLISSLVLCGFEVYGDDEEICFKIEQDAVKETEM